MSERSHRPIFVVGCPRSGTTLLQQMLHSHPRIALAPETRFVHTSYDHRREFGDLEDAGHRRELGEWITKRKESKFRPLELDPDATVEEIVAAPPTLGSALATVFRAYARDRGKARWGDKRPSYIRRVDDLRRMFPDAQFVHLVRDGRDAVSSLKKMPWYDGNVITAALTWREAVDHGRRLVDRLGPGTFYEFRYEDLVAEPERELRALCEFLGEDFEPAMTEPQRRARETVPQTRKWHLRTHEAPNSKNVGAWEGRLDDWEISVIEYAIGSRLGRHGYEPSGAPRPSAGDIARIQRTAAHRWRAQRKKAAADKVNRRREFNPVESLLSGSALDGPVRASGS